MGHPWGHRSAGRLVSRRDVVASMGTMVVATSTAGCSSGSGAGHEEFAAQQVVNLTDDLVYDPDELPVAPGGTVVWENVGSTTHTVTAYEAGIPEDAAYFASGGATSEEAARDAYPDAGGIGVEESFQHTFDTLGTYEYFCIPHESAGMTGVIKVSEEGPHL